MEFEAQNLRFLPDGPDIPTDLIEAQEKGEVIFVCGAGVSCLVGLPLFRGLVEQVYKALGESWAAHIAEREGMNFGGAIFGQYDRVLRSLERRLVGNGRNQRNGMRERIRAAVADALSSVKSVGELHDHLALLKLSRDTNGRVRLLTTNFDSLFERAWNRSHAKAIDSHAGPAMPPPNGSGFTGVLHLHGRLSDSELKPSLTGTDLVLTSAEFGDAYLRSGWASRYIYDVARVCTVILVGYQADDPPMRYLLEALEADRERYPDLKKVFAFAPVDDGDEERQRALWLAKGIEPIPYRVMDESHASLYTALREWRRYADDPTAWRVARLTSLMTNSPREVTDDQRREVVALLQRGDASELLGKVAPDAAWLPVLVSQRVFDSEQVSPGRWIAARINDPEMIRACATLHQLDEQTRWRIERAFEGTSATAITNQITAWQLILRSKASRPLDLEDPWFQARGRIRHGQIDYEARRIAANALRPRLIISKPFLWPLEESNPEQAHALHRLVSIDFQPAAWPNAKEILSAFPNELEEECALFAAAERALVDASEEAKDVGFLEGYDRASADVPSVAPHAQNEHRSGFYPVVRVLSELWSRIALKDAARARSLAAAWSAQPFLLTTRLYLHALSFSEVFASEDCVIALNALDDRTFWMTGAQREIMRLLAIRWRELPVEARLQIEKRLRGGPARVLLPPNALDDDEWDAIRENDIFKRLGRISNAGGMLSTESTKLLSEISARHPTWVLGPGERDDFRSWFSSGSGPSGEPDLLSDEPDATLVQSAMRLQREQHFEQSNIWRLLCNADPQRALRGLVSDAGANRWDTHAWQPFFWAASEVDDPTFQSAIADVLVQIPDEPLYSILSSATSWLQRRRQVLMVATEGVKKFSKVWDHLASVAYRAKAADPKVDQDIESSALNEPGGILVWTLHDELVEARPAKDAGIPPHIRERLSHATGAIGRAGLLARVFLARDLAYLYAVDSSWTAENLLPRFDWTHPDAPSLWRARSAGKVGSPQLFKTLKSAFLAAFQRRDGLAPDLVGLVDHLLHVGLSSRRPDTADYDLSSNEVRQALVAGGAEARQHASWLLWRWMSPAEGDHTDKGQFWRTEIGPFFRDAWPLDATARDEGATKNLVLMALEASSEFNDAVDAIVDVVVPYKLYSIASSLRLDRKHKELPNMYPRSFVRLLDALIDPAQHPVPDDLSETLVECINADSSLADDPRYVRLYGLRRQRSA